MHKDKHINGYIREYRYVYIYIYIYTYICVYVYLAHRYPGE
jgi:hypothetical protein